ncbi:hypothetical protein [Myxococcus vastator]|uniref:hypothetical protein n=1 Tax=Myxococcus vastator TaxID=2709664 RepID=UPI0013D65132|nr:hypothetical protein [Myxococcus vastator]
MPVRLFSDCTWMGRELLVEWISSRMGEAPILAETVTTGDGTFVLEGLPDGPLSVWALNEAGAAMNLHPGRIPAPTTEAAAEFLAIERGFIHFGEEDAPLAAYEAAGPTTRFRNVPPGPATIFLLSGYVPAHFHREELMIPASGEIVHTLVPNWQPLPSPGQ